MMSDPFVFQVGNELELNQAVATIDFSRRAE
jgi:hypothetical protein